MPSLAQAAETLTALARSRAADDRERLLQALATLCENADFTGRPEIQDLLTDLLTTLLAQADPVQRSQMADQLAQAAWTPVALTLQLTRDPLGEAALTALVRRAASSPGLRRALAHQSGLTRDHAEALTASASGPLRAELQARFDLPPLAAPTGSDEAALMSKLRGVGRLTPGVLLRLLREGRGAAFRAGLAALSATELSAVDDACAAENDDALRALCVRAGLDRAVLPEVLTLVAAKA